MDVLPRRAALLVLIVVVASAIACETTMRRSGLSSAAAARSPEASAGTLPSTPNSRVDSNATAAGTSGTSADEPSVAPRTPPVDLAETPPAPIRLARGLEVDRAAGELRLAAQSALDAGWLEQAICLAGTREHESLLVVDTPPRLIHAGLLMLGLEPGRPGRWRIDEATGAVVREPPTGPELEILLRYVHPTRGEVEEPLSKWFLGRDGGAGPAQPWRFAGSLEETDDQGTVYVADFSGSVAGLVTFGDEVIAHAEVLADRIDVEREPFRVAEARVPPPGTAVSVVIRPVR